MNYFSKQDIMRHTMRHCYNCGCTLCIQKSMAPIIINEDATLRGKVEGLERNITDLETNQKEILAILKQLKDKYL